jgi:hypothetical protein
MRILAAFGMDYSQLPKDLAASESLLDSWVNRINQKMASVRSPAANTSGIEQMAVSMERLATSSGRLDSVMTKMGRTLSSGVGLIAIAGGFATLERAFDRAIKKAEQFQTVTISIGASLQSAYKFVGGQSGKELSGKDSFLAAMDKAQAVNTEILKRQAKNILTYEEQVRSFQAGILPGAKRGLTQGQTLDVSERLAIVAKSAGVSGERIPQEVRLALGGGANISRSIIGRLLDIKNKDLEGKKGDDYVKFIGERTKGFGEASGVMSTSIKAQISTFTSKLDVMLAGVGQRAFGQIGPMLQQLSAFLDKGGANKLGDAMANTFSALFKILQNIVQSGALDVIAKFLNLISSFGGELVIIAALGKLAGLLGGLRGLAGSFTMGLRDMAVQAEATAVGLEKDAAAMTEVGAAAGVGGKGGVAGGFAARGPKGIGNALTGASSEAMLMSLSAEELATLGLVKTTHANGTPVLRNMKGFEGAGKFANQGRITSAAQQYVGGASAESNLGALALGAGSAETQSAMAAEEEAAMARKKANRVGAANKLMGALGRGVQGLVIGGLAGEALESQTEGSKSGVERGVGRGVSGALEAGLTVGMATGNPIAGVVAAGVGGLAKVIKGMFDDADKVAKDAQQGLDDMLNKHPILKGIKEQRDKIAEAHNLQHNDRLNLGNNNNMLQDTVAGIGKMFGFGDYTNAASTQNLLTNRTRLGLGLNKTISGAKGRIGELTDAGTAKEQQIKEEEDLDAQLKLLEAKAANEKLGAQTLPRQLRGLDIARQISGVKLDKAANEGQLALDADISKGPGDSEAKQKLQAARQKMELTVVQGMESTILKLGELGKEAFMNGSKYLQERFAKQAEAMKEASSLPVAERNKFVTKALGEWDRDYKEKTQDLADRIADERDNLKKNRIDRARLAVLGQFDDQTWGLQQQKMALEQQRAALAPRQAAFQDEEFGMQERGLYQSRRRLQEDHPFQMREAGFGAQMAGINAQQAQMNLSMFGSGAPQYQAMESAIRYKVDAQIGQEHPITPGEYEDTYKKSKELELQRLGIEAQLADDAKKRASLNVGRVEEDYVNALQQITHNLTGVGLSKQNANIERQAQGISRQEQSIGMQRAYYEHGVTASERADQGEKLDLAFGRQTRALGRDTRAYNERVGQGGPLPESAPISVSQINNGLAQSSSYVGSTPAGVKGGGVATQTLTMKIDVSGTINSKIAVGGTVNVDPKDLEKHINSILDKELPKIIATDLPPILERIRKRTP